MGNTQYEIAIIDFEETSRWKLKSCFGKFLKMVMEVVKGHARFVLLVHVKWIGFLDCTCIVV